MDTVTAETKLAPTQIVLPAPEPKQGCLTRFGSLKVPRIQPTDIHNQEFLYSKYMGELVDFKEEFVKNPHNPQIKLALEAVCNQLSPAFVQAFEVGLTYNKANEVNKLLKLLANAVGTIDQHKDVKTKKSRDILNVLTEPRKQGFNEEHALKCLRIRLIRTSHFLIDRFKTDGSSFNSYYSDIRNNSRMVFGTTIKSIITAGLFAANFKIMGSIYAIGFAYSIYRQARFCIQTGFNPMDLTRIQRMLKTVNINDLSNI